MPDTKTRYCEKCGMELRSFKGPRKYHFDPHTGKQIDDTKTYYECPNFRHFWAFGNGHTSSWFFETYVAN